MAKKKKHVPDDPKLAGGVIDLTISPLKPYSFETTQSWMTYAAECQKQHKQEAAMDALQKAICNEMKGRFEAENEACLLKGVIGATYERINHN